LPIPSLPSLLATMSGASPAATAIGQGDGSGQDTMTDEGGMPTLLASQSQAGLAAKNVQSKQEKTAKTGDLGFVGEAANERVNPLAVTQLGNTIIMQFRRKAMAAIIFQSIFVNVIAFIVDRQILFQFPRFHWSFYLASWIIPAIVLSICFCFRYKRPVNYIMFGIFTVMFGFTLGLLAVPMERYTVIFAKHPEQYCSTTPSDLARGVCNTNWSPQCYGMAWHTISLCCFALVSCIPHGRKGLIRMGPVSIAIAIVTGLLGPIAYVYHWSYVGPPMFAIVAFILNALSILWIGYQMDRLSDRLQVDEFMYPVMLVWCELFVAMAVTFTLLFTVMACLVGGDVATSGCDGLCYGCYGCYCDCYYGGANDENRNDSADQDTTIPDQQDMQP